MSTRKFTFAPATREQIKARIALEGPAGSGKTLAALTVARELADGGPVAVIDTERGSASLYADRFEFQVVDFTPPYDPRDLIAALDAAKEAGFPVVVIDSLSHFWAGEGGVLQIVDETPGRSKFTSGWAEATPLHNRMVDAVLSYPGHVIATMRTKTAYVLQKNEKGKEQPVKVGMSPVQREGVDYEFTVVYDLALDHSVTVTKSRSSHIAEVGMYRADQLEALAADLRGFLADGVEVVGAQSAGDELKAALAAVGFGPEEARQRALAMWKGRGLSRSVARDVLDEMLAEASELRPAAEQPDCSEELLDGTVPLDEGEPVEEPAA